MSSQLANIQSLSGPRPPFLRIPREIRDMIYDTVFDGATLSLVFQNSRSDPGENKIHCTQKPATDLLMVSRQVHQEALTRFRFHLNVEDDYCETQDLDAEDLHLTSSMRWALTSLKVDVDLVSHLFPHYIDYPNVKSITVGWPGTRYVHTLNVAKEDQDTSGDLDKVAAEDTMCKLA